MNQRVASAAGMAAPLLFGGALVVLTLVENHFLRSLGWDPLQAPTLDWPSGLALGPYGSLMTAVFITTGLLTGLFGLAFAVLLAVGVGNGYFTITAITLLQQRTPAHMIGRVMSMILFANVGLVPVSQALSGLFIKLSLEGLFIGAGLLMIVLAAWTALDREARSMGEYMLEPDPN